MQIECPHCHVEFNSDDIAQTLKNGNFKCPVCGKRFPSPLEDHKSASSASKVKYLALFFVLLGIAAAFAIVHFMRLADKTTETVKTAAPAVPLPVSTPPPAQTPPVTAVTSPVVAATQTTLAARKESDKMRFIRTIAAMYHVSHSYTKEGGFVCLDMADDVWNQLNKFGIDARIMGGTIRENITTWSYRKLMMESDHAWVVAMLSPTEKVAIETTAGVVITQEMENASAYFRGIEFDNPEQIKRFERLRIKLYEVCHNARQLIEDWNENVAGKKRKSEETIAKQSRLEQREQDCEDTFNQLQEFKSRAIYY